MSEANVYWLLTYCFLSIDVGFIYLFVIIIIISSQAFYPILPGIKRFVRLPFIIVIII